MADSIDIYNMAIAHLGVSLDVQSLTERTTERLSCSRFYDQARREILGGLPWAFAKKLDILALVAENPTPEWKYSYQYPSDCLQFRRILSTIMPTSPSTVTDVYTRNPILTQTVPFLRSGTTLLSDWPTAWGEYTYDCTDPTLFDATFSQALAYKLAWYILPRLTAGDPFKLRPTIATAFNATVSEAAANMMNEQNPDPLPESEFIIARGYGGDWLL